MPGTKGDSETGQLSFRVPPDMLVLLDSLVGTLHGANRSDVARNLIRAHLFTIYPAGKLPLA